jgi:hypothetical protein
MFPLFRVTSGETSTLDARRRAGVSGVALLSRRVSPIPALASASGRASPWAGMVGHDVCLARQFARLDERRHTRLHAYARLALCPAAAAALKTHARGRSSSGWTRPLRPRGRVGRVHDALRQGRRAWRSRRSWAQPHHRLRGASSQRDADDRRAQQPGVIAQFERESTVGCWVSLSLCDLSRGGGGGNTAHARRAAPSQCGGGRRGCRGPPACERSEPPTPDAHPSSLPPARSRSPARRRPTSLTLLTKTTHCRRCVRKTGV